MFKIGFIPLELTDKTDPTVKTINLNILQNRKASLVQTAHSCYWKQLNQRWFQPCTTSIVQVSCLNINLKLTYDDAPNTPLLAENGQHHYCKEGCKKKETARFILLSPTLQYFPNGLTFYLTDWILLVLIICRYYVGRKAMFDSDFSKGTWF